MFVTRIATGFCFNFFITFFTTVFARTLGRELPHRVPNTSVYLGRRPALSWGETLEADGRPLRERGVGGQAPPPPGSQPGAKGACALRWGGGREAPTSWLYLPGTEPLRQGGGTGEMLAAGASWGDAPALDCDLGHLLRERGASLLLKQLEGRSGYGLSMRFSKFS